MGEVVRAIPAQKRNLKLSNNPPSDVALLRAVDSMPETRGMGVVLVSGSTARWLRRAQPGQSFIVYEYRRSPLSSDKMHADTRPRTRRTSPASEWLNLGLSCGGAALSWIGALGSSVLEPFTGGLDTPATVFLWGGALSTSAQCGVSVTRVTAMETGHDALLREMDNSKTYYWSMVGLDVFGILGAKGVITDVLKTNDALEVTRAGWKRALAASLNRHERLELTEKLGLIGSKRVAAQTISRIAKQKILASITSAIGMGMSSYSGTVHDLVVWIVTPPPKR